MACPISFSSYNLDLIPGGPAPASSSSPSPCVITAGGHPHPKIVINLPPGVELVDQAAKSISTNPAGSGKAGETLPPPANDDIYSSFYSGGDNPAYSFSHPNSEADYQERISTDLFPQEGGPPPQQFSDPSHPDNNRVYTTLESGKMPKTAPDHADLNLPAEVFCRDQQHPSVLLLPDLCTWRQQQRVPSSGTSNANTAVGFRLLPAKSDDLPLSWGDGGGISGSFSCRKDTMMTRRTKETEETDCEETGI